MNQCVPSWEVDENPNKITSAHSNSLPLTPDVPTLDYEVAELTWENGQLSMHGLGPPRLPTKSHATTTHNKYTWDKPRAGGTLESIVDQATFFPQYKSAVDIGDAITDELDPWFNIDRSVVVPSSGATTSTAVLMDALVPCNNNNQNNGGKPMHALDSGVECTRVESCSEVTPFEKGQVARVAVVPPAHEWSSCRDQSVTGSAPFGRDSRQVTVDTCDKEFRVNGRFTSTSMGSPGNTSSGKQVTADDHDSVCHSKPQREAGREEVKKKASGKSSISTKRSRAAAVHNQSERKRRDKINQRMKTLQKMVPNSSKTDKASMLDEVIEYLKQLQAQVNMMSRMNMSPMMLPLAVQHQLQMSMMAPMMGMGTMGMGVGMGHVMDMNTAATIAAAASHHNMAGVPPILHPNAFMPSLSNSWETARDRLHPSASLMPDPMSTFLAACQSQPMTMDTYSRMVAMYQQQLQQNPGPGPKNL